MKWIIGIVIVAIVVGGAILIVKKGQIHADTTTGASATVSVTASVTSTATSQSVDMNPPAPPTVSYL